MIMCYWAEWFHFHFLQSLTFHRNALVLVATSQYRLTKIEKEIRDSEMIAEKRQVDEMFRRRTIPNAGRHWLWHWATSPTVSSHRLWWTGGPQPGSLAGRTRGSRLAKVFIPLSQVIDWLPCAIFQSLTAFREQNTVSQAFCERSKNLSQSPWSIHLI